MVKTQEANETGYRLTVSKILTVHFVSLYRETMNCLFCAQA
jgi:hypothetical protein